MLTIIRSNGISSELCDRCRIATNLYQFGIDTMTQLPVRELSGWYCGEECALMSCSPQITAYGAQLLAAGATVRTLSGLARSANARERERAKLAYMSPEAKEERARERERLREQHEALTRVEAKTAADRQNAAVESRRAAAKASPETDQPEPMSPSPVVPVIKW